MKSIPWGVPNLYQFHSNPEQLYGYSDDLDYSPTEEQLYDAFNFYEEWHEGNEENDGWDEDYPSKWTLEFFNRQVDEAMWSFEIGEYSEKPLLSDFTDAQMEWIWNFVLRGDFVEWGKNRRNKLYK